MTHTHIYNWLEQSDDLEEKIDLEAKEIINRYNNRNMELKVLKNVFAGTKFEVFDPAAIASMIDNNDNSFTIEINIETVFGDNIVFESEEMGSSNSEYTNIEYVSKSHDEITFYFGFTLEKNRECTDYPGFFAFEYSDCNLVDADACIKELIMFLFPDTVQHDFYIRCDCMKTEAGGMIRIDPVFFPTEKPLNDICEQWLSE